MAHAHPQLTSLPPGQHLIETFPRYGTHLFMPVPDTSRLDAISIDGAVTRPLFIAIADLATLPRRDTVADFHCVAGWSVQGLRWGGVPFRELYDSQIAPVAKPGVTHVRFVGIDGFRSVLVLEDALEDDVLVADHFDGLPLAGHHGGPVRLVFPSRYGYKSTKHLSAVELHTSEPSEDHVNRVLNVGLTLLKAHPRGRVAAEERHRHLPSPSVRWIYFHVLHPVLRYLCKVGDRRSAPNP